MQMSSKNIVQTYVHNYAVYSLLQLTIYFPQSYKVNEYLPLEEKIARYRTVYRIVP